MEMTRRGFVKLLTGSLAALAALAGGMFHAAGSSQPVRFLRAVKAKVFPGKVKPVDVAEIRQQAKWLG